eukprot:TRINITY_DN1114_c0_g1_i1.p1 TRINITY_DN1114_c0_g1~~TRINITY_DN1114_c0_g1_i1.p1  ORF type:complete len:107 (-),score=18.55 TRINITY_DN1114_c0_g1_i1:45-365(-)
MEPKSLFLSEKENIDPKTGKLSPDLNRNSKFQPKSFNQRKPLREKVTTPQGLEKFKPLPLEERRKLEGCKSYDFNEFKVKTGFINAHKQESFGLNLVLINQRENRF